MNTNNPITKNQYSLEPKTFNELMNFAEIVSKSGMIPKDYVGKPGNIIVAVQMGVEIGLQPMQSLQNISVINGRPSLWGDALIALVRKSKVCEYVKETLSANGQVATCEVKRRDEKQSELRTFSIQDASTAGLLGKDNWKKYPKRMLQLRARAWALRDVFPEVLLGMQVTEEMEDFTYTQNQTLNKRSESSPETLEQMGLSSTKVDGKLIVKGNTYGKTEMLKNLGFQYENKVWSMSIADNNVIDGEIEEKKESTNELSFPKIPKIVNLSVLKLYLKELNLDFEEKIEGDKTWIVITSKEISPLKDILKELKFKNTKSRGICKDVTYLIPNEPEIVYEEIKEVHEDTNTTTMTPFDDVVVTQNAVQNELPFSH